MRTLIYISILFTALAMLSALSILAPNSDFEGGSGYAAMFAALLSVPAVVLALVVNLYRSHRGRLSVCALVVSVLPMGLVFAIAYGERSTLRQDISATITYEGEHEYVILEYSHMYGATGGRRTKRGEVVSVDSIRDDGRIVLSWGPTFSDQLSEDLSVGIHIPKGGSSVVVVITLTDQGASFEVTQPNQ